MARNQAQEQDQPQGQWNDTVLLEVGDGAPFGKDSVLKVRVLSIENTGNGRSFKTVDLREYVDAPTRPDGRPGYKGFTKKGLRLPCSVETVEGLIEHLTILKTELEAEAAAAAAAPPAVPLKKVPVTGLRQKAAAAKKTPAKKAAPRRKTA